MKHRTNVLRTDGTPKHKLYRCPKCKRDWTPLNRLYWRIADQIADEMADFMMLDGQILCNPCEFNTDTRGDTKTVYIR